MIDVLNPPLGGTPVTDPQDAEIEAIKAELAERKTHDVPMTRLLDAVEDYLCARQVGREPGAILAAYAELKGAYFRARYGSVPSPSSTVFGAETDQSKREE